ncbi:hypothetical protein BDN72DRAFT_863919 [Pluteus cervinus]|uniref:Uncharacterized protein n=1 Tax=Pluteus cervinus TaxID=181527 RepID=A0ACD3A6L1_9AGAR|nr:hypothetical protein BDN72DRAFT_863919 [Pluteus cervinus]
MDEVIPSRATRRSQSLGSLGSSRTNREIDETRPLLSRQGSTSFKQPSYLNGTPGTRSNQIAVSPQVWPSQVPVHHRLREQGWLEYFLPDSTVYFVHPTHRVITEIDLYSTKRLDVVHSYIDRYLINPVPQGMELWLREIAPSPGLPPPKKGSGLASLWVNHTKKNITFTPPFEVPMNCHIRPSPPPEDQVDMEYRYWLFMESHPAHCSLPHGARTDAMDVLSWAWSDRLLPNHRSLPAPFSQEECQELLSLLRSFPDQGEAIQAVVQNRVIARVLLRVAHWRQVHFRSTKPLPDDVGSGPIQPPKRARSIGRVFIDFIVSCVCLGIPYIFFQRNNYHRLDEESGFRQGAPLFVIGACTCLVAAIVLSASVTFLSLPGLDGIAKIAGVVAILCASFSMATTVLAVFKFKANMERTTSHMNEGFLALSGATIKDPIHGDYQFDDLSRWTIMGLIGGLAGIITSSVLLLRR